jgi:hypothetical protein
MWVLREICATNAMKTNQATSIAVHSQVSFSRQLSVVRQIVKFCNSVSGIIPLMKRSGGLDTLLDCQR